uniref:Methyltransferase-like protein 17, mitochondrial n=1 Tax=Dermatophagoides pteronyssinus TaxID=6956 RepID=A0A6P6Y0W5_DERPT|nr:methyltransferase-like protein 17, mitochondrial [Dermatophagoides pteronyssinus]
MNSFLFKSIIDNLCRRQSIRYKHNFTLKENLTEFFENVDNKYRNQPGNRRLFSGKLPFKLHFAATSVINKYRNKNFRRKVKEIEDDFLRIFVNRESEQQQQDNVENTKKINVDESFDYEMAMKNIGFKQEMQERQRTLYFEKDFYNNHECASYMAARLPANFAVLSHVFNEIRNEEPDFQPTSVFDFGSGIGTTIWAADHYWNKTIQEYFCVDMNENMNQLSRELLQRGTLNDEHILDRIFYRQFLPAKHFPSYDLVVSAFSLLEMEDTRNRLYVVENLWQKTSGCLVLIEHGSKAGFQAIMEARNFLLQINRKIQLEQQQSNPPNQPDRTEIDNRLLSIGGSIMAPCPHDLICPRQSILNKKSYCNFGVHYQPLDYGQTNPRIKSEKFTFLIMKKHGHFNWKEEQKNWSKIIEPVVSKAGHAICRICDNDGLLKQIIVSKSKTDKHVYKCIKSARWGDKLPMDVNECTVDTETETTLTTTKTDE